MGANLTGPRPDITYLRRRMKREETALATTAPAPSATASSLSLSRGPETEARTETIANTLEPVVASTVPYATGMTWLEEVNDACRLNPIQSAIGSLLIENAAVAGWQLKDGSSGFLYSSQGPVTEEPESYPASFMNRPLVQFVKDQLVVGLRGVEALKRLIVVPSNGKPLKVTTVGGTTIEMRGEPFTALYISLVGNVLEFRKEDFQRTIVETFILTTQL